MPMRMRRFEKRPILNTEVVSVRQFMTWPICAKMMPASVMVVAWM